MFVNVSQALLLDRVKEFKLLFSTVSVVTNFFNSKLESDDIYLFIDNEGLFFFDKSKKGNLGRYYFLATHNGFEICNFNIPTNERLVSEYIYQTKVPHTVVVEHYNNLGFSSYANLKKMSLLDKDDVTQESASIEECTSLDLPFLRTVFDFEFDSISERNPSDNDLQDAIERTSIFKYTVKGRIAGFYWADTKKFLSELRYLFVRESFRGKGFGKALFKHHLVQTRLVKKNQLWVLESNLQAINLYKKFGYQFDKLQSLIFFKDAV